MVDFEGPDGDGVFILRLNDGNDNRFTPEVFAKVFRHLDAVEAHDGATALVITGTGKFFSNGFNMKYLVGSSADALGNAHKIFARLLQFSVPTISAINGHCYALGSMVSLCCDFRVMNMEKGFYCANELLIGFPFDSAMTAVFTAKLGPSVRNRVMIGAERFTGKQALDTGIVDYAVPGAEVLPTAIKLANEHAPKGNNKGVFGKVKLSMYQSSINRIKESEVLSKL